MGFTHHAETNEPDALAHDHPPGFLCTTAYPQKKTPGILMDTGRSLSGGEERCCRASRAGASPRRELRMTMLPTRGERMIRRHAAAATAAATNPGAGRP